MLAFNGLRAAALPYLFLFVLDLCKAIHHRAAVLLERRGLAIQVSFDDRFLHSMFPLARLLGFQAQNASSAWMCSCHALADEVYNGLGCGPRKKNFGNARLF